MSSTPAITTAQRHAIDQIICLETCTKIAIVALALLMAASFAFTLLGLQGKTPMSIPVYTFVATVIPITALQIIEMRKQVHAVSIGKELSLCLAMLRGYDDGVAFPKKTD